ncbi:N-acetylmuramoyl-L-alanine amidase family protein [Vulgatibacter incomptus]|uniref:N-acetylmuramoyl-L-alanine amidase n=1 Tax=Vulgatibacter incomptus TaxID=1391653 RepID=A0A0K1P9N2_9BACT|nr:N-acetylmuramoyl-L-alanine amidase [Vulgatibacter incomptus]AKU90220.1 N-acetylmuramoyl-L-alanine amidase [Vulgatibacter incomptus]
MPFRAAAVLLLVVLSMGATAVATTAHPAALSNAAPVSAPAEVGAHPSATRSPADAGNAKPARRGLRVVIDPGHGGDKDGAIGPNRLKEKDVALAIALELRKELASRGHEAILTRERDLPLALGPRIRVANERGADLFVSIHLNSLPEGADRARVSGVETYFLSADATDDRALALAHAENSDDSPEAAGIDAGPLGAILADLARTEAHASSARLAYLTHSHLLAGIGARDRGVRQAPFTVLQGAEMPAVLVEVGYISHPGEAARLETNAERLRVARALADGIDAFQLEVVEKSTPHDAAGKGGSRYEAPPVVAGDEGP